MGNSLDDGDELRDINNKSAVHVSFIQEVVEVQAESSIAESVSNQTTKSNSSGSYESSSSNDSDSDSLILIVTMGIMVSMARSH